MRNILTEAIFSLENELESEKELNEYLLAAGVNSSKILRGFVEYLENKIPNISDENKANKLKVAHNIIKTQSSLLPSKKTSEIYWTNRSVINLARNHNPIDVISEISRNFIYAYSEAGGSINPLDPFSLAKFCGIDVVPLEDISDARTRSVNGKFVLEFNPNRSRGRVRYSICHEIVHTFFPDCGEEIRNRSTHDQMRDDDWQLEMLCNIGAGELLIPFKELPSEVKNKVPTTEDVLKVQRKFEASLEAVFLRLSRVNHQEFCVFSASRKEPSDTYQIDYTRPSSTWATKIPNGSILPKNSVVKSCTAIGFSDSKIEKWLSINSEIKVDCIGIPPYIGKNSPRVMGVVSMPHVSHIDVNTIKYVRGDATKPPETEDGSVIIAHIVNDKTANWGGPFAMALKKRWASTQQAFQDWVQSHPQNLSLGNIHFSFVEPQLVVASMISQKGYGESNRPRIRYHSLHECLVKLSKFALENNSSIHMPRIGIGQARGNWDIISELIEDTLCAKRVKVTVYTLPSAEVKPESQGRLDFDG